MSTDRIRVLLADDHNVLREGLKALLDREPDLTVVGEAANGRDALRLAGELYPDVVVMDIGMPDLNGVEATRRIGGDVPGTRVLCLSVHSEASMIHAMLEAGARGYILKTGAGRELVHAVRVVARGETYLSPSVTSTVVAQHLGGSGPESPAAYESLTAREREVLQLIAEGNHTKGVAKRLGIRPKTVLVHRENIMRKLEIDSVAGLVRYALKEGVCEL
ncbi:MAG: response regulator transcription factor [Longimicrobiales bacterium]